MSSVDSSPFVFNVRSLLNNPDLPETVTHTGPSPERIGAEMLAIPQDSTVTVEATLTPLGSGILADAEVQGELRGECSRCLSPLNQPAHVRVSQVFAADDDFITGDAEDDTDAGSGDDIGQIAPDDTIDLLQAVIDELGIQLPFNPTCEGGCPEQVETPAPDGISGEQSENRVDPRWAGLEKFLDQKQ